MIALGNGEVRMPCPWCIKKKPSLCANQRKGVFLCHRCGKRGPVSLLGMARVEGPAEDVDPETEQLPEGFRPLVGTEREMDAFLIWRYLQMVRGIHPDAIHKAGVGWVDSGKYQLHAIFPIALGFVARSIVPGRQGYRNSRGLPRADILYDPFDRLQAGKPVYLVEGPIDALRARKAVCSLGKEVSDGQLDLLASYGVPVVVAMDGDARLKCHGIARRLRLRGVRASWLALPPCRDPGNIGHAGLVKLPRLDP